MLRNNLNTSEEISENTKEVLQKQRVTNSLAEWMLPKIQKLKVLKAKGTNKRVKEMINAMKSLILRAENEVKTL